jgi:hypothetical protein
MKRMKMKWLVLALALVASASCKKELMHLATHFEKSKIASSPDHPGYQRFVIEKGQQYADNTEKYLVLVNTKELDFDVVFDSSAIYTTASPSNQDDINKLYRFADNNANDHHRFSARFGWAWNPGQNKLNLFGYIYNNGVEQNKLLGAVPLNTPAHCAIAVDGNKYVFVLNGQRTEMRRASTTATGEGYKLFPFFGGTETAPHTIDIDIKELPA